MAVGVAISPIPIAAIILLLMTKRGAGNGWAFVVGWILGLILLVGGLMFFIESIEKRRVGEPGLGLPILRIVFGLFLLLVALRSWRRRPRPGEDPGVPRWMETLDRFTFVKSLIMGALLVSLNLKNLPISISAAVLLARHHSAHESVALSFLIFTLIATIGVTTPVVVARLGGEKADRILQNWKRWLRIHNPSIMAGLFLILGSISLIKGLTSFF